jgi:hypothetical protein
LNLRPSGYEPDELPGCSTPRHHFCAEPCMLGACALGEPECMGLPCIRPGIGLDAWAAAVLATSRCGRSREVHVPDRKAAVWDDACGRPGDHRSGPTHPTGLIGSGNSTPTAPDRAAVPRRGPYSSFLRDGNPSHACLAANIAGDPAGSKKLTRSPERPSQPGAKPVLSSLDRVATPPA